MIKGCHKRIVFLKDTGSDFFDEAYFVLKPNAFSKKESDVVLEATKIVNGIIDENIKPKERKKIFGILFAFFAGILLGGGVAIALSLIAF